MGVTDVLRKVLDAAGSEIDLRRFRSGIDVQVGRKRKRKRPLRIGLDVSHWIYKATHGYGHALADENHLTNYGRYRLLEQQKESNSDAQQQDVTNESGNSNNTRKDISPEQLQKFVTQCCLYVLARLKALREETRAEILVVLDGATPPIKRAVVEKRSHVRKEAVRRRDAPVDVSLDEDDDAVDDDDNNDAMDSYNNERTKANRRAGAGRYFSHVVVDLIKAMRTNEIPFMVSPYEADGQLAWMSREGYIDLIITEDSDLIAQGGTCMLYKLNVPMQNHHPGYNYNRNNNDNNQREDHATTRSGSYPLRGVLVTRDDLGAVTISKNPKDGGSTLDWKDMSDAMLAVAFVAAGSDYCEKLRGIGLVTACHIVRDSFLFRHKDEDDFVIPPLRLVLDKLFQETHDKSMRTDLKRQEEYRKQFLAAVFMYRHPVVFCPIERRCKICKAEGDPELTLYAPYEALFDNERRRAQIIGEIVKAPLCTFIAEGWVSPRSKTVYANSPEDINNLPKLVRTFFGVLDQAENEADSPAAAEGGSSSPVSDVGGGTARGTGANRADHTSGEEQAGSAVRESDGHDAVGKEGSERDNAVEKKQGGGDEDVLLDGPAASEQYLETTEDSQNIIESPSFQLETQALLASAASSPRINTEIDPNDTQSPDTSARLETQAPDDGHSQNPVGNSHSQLETQASSATAAMSPLFLTQMN